MKYTGANPVHDLLDIEGSEGHVQSSNERIKMKQAKKKRKEKKKNTKNRKNKWDSGTRRKSISITDAWRIHARARNTKMGTR